MIVIFLDFHCQYLDHQSGSDLELLCSVWVEILLGVQRLSLESIKPLLLYSLFLSHGLISIII